MSYLGDRQAGRHETFLGKVDSNEANTQSQLYNDASSVITRFYQCAYYDKTGLLELILKCVLIPFFISFRVILFRPSKPRSQVYPGNYNSNGRRHTTHRCNGNIVIFYLSVEQLKRWMKFSAAEHSVPLGIITSLLDTGIRPSLGVSSLDECCCCMTSLGPNAWMTSSSSASSSSVGGATSPLCGCPRSGRDGEVGDESFDACWSSTSAEGVQMTSSLLRSSSRQ